MHSVPQKNTSMRARASLTHREGGYLPECLGYRAVLAIENNACDDYVSEKVTAVQRGGFYEVESVSTQDVGEEVDDIQSYEAGKSKTAAALANSAGSSTYIDPRASVRSSVSSLGDVPATTAWRDTGADTAVQLSTEKQISETAAELSDIRAFLSHVRTQRGIAEAELQAFMK